jgi:hypothetical protein
LVAVQARVADCPFDTADALGVKDSVGLDAETLVLELVAEPLPLLWPSPAHAATTAAAASAETARRARVNVSDAR